VASGEEQKKEGAGQGFAGLSSMVSDVDMTVEPPEQKTQNKPGPATNNPQPRATSSQEDHVAKPAPQAYQAPVQPSGGSSGGKWLLGIGAVIGVIWLVWASGNKNTSSPSSYTPSNYATAPTSQSSVSEPQAPRRPSEEMPPAGRDHVLGAAQIRYCLAEDIRMEAAKGSLSSYADSDVDQFNAMVADYNSRCGAFKYRSGALESARSDIEPFRFELAAEGRGYFAGKPATASVSPSPTITLNPEPPAVVPEQKVSSIANPQLSGPERESIEAACSTDKYVNGPAAYKNCIAGQMDALRNGVRRPDLSRLSGSERESIEAACSTDKYVNGPAAYNACLTQQASALTPQNRRPDLSRLSSSERESIEAACSTDKYVNGPSAYNNCLSSQLHALEQQGSRPNLSGLSASARQSIEAACSTDKYVNGPAAYNACLSSQLAQLRN
jgi:hypothetical protein